MGTGAGSADRGGVPARGGTGAGSGATNSSISRPPAYAARECRRHSSAAPPAPSTRASSSQGQRSIFCVGVSVAGAASGSLVKPGSGTLVGVGAVFAGASSASDGAGLVDVVGAAAAACCCRSAGCGVGRVSAVRVGGGGLVVDAAGACRRLVEGVDAAGEVVSAGRVTVPLRLKFDSSRGPMESVAGVLLVGPGAVWARASVGTSASPADAITKPMRETALITFRPCA